MLELQNLHAYYGSSHILHGVSLGVGRGEVLSILGRNGVGKTTFLKSLMGLTDRTTGTIRLDGKDITDEPTFERAKAGIAYVPQGREIVPGFTVEENILMGCHARRDGKRSVPPLIWDLFPFLKDHLRRKGTNLSGGQQQQLAIARALTTDPTILLLDEPTEGIQPNIVQEIERTIQRLNKELGLTVILVEQKIQFARTISTQFAILEKGAVAASGSGGELSDELIRKHMAV